MLYERDSGWHRGDTGGRTQTLKLTSKRLASANKRGRQADNGPVASDREHEGCQIVIKGGFHAGRGVFQGYQ